MLFVSHTFPPQGGGGSRRVAQLVTLLARAGCRVAALTRSLPEALARRAGLAFDAEPLARLQAEPNVRVLQVPSLAGLYYRLRPRRPGVSVLAQARLRRGWRDPAYLWAPLALGRALLARFDCVYATGPSFAGFLVGWAAAVARRKPLVLEYRDGWLLDPLFETSPRQARVIAAIEAALLRRAALVVVATRGVGEQLCRCYGLPPGRLVLLRNGYLPDAAAAGALEVPGWEGEGYHVAHVGALAAGRNAEPAIRAVAAAAAVAGRPVVLHFVGTRPEDEAEIRSLARRHGVEERVRCRGFVSRRVSLALMARADALLLLLNTSLADARGAGVPGKLGDYLLMNRSILATEAAAGVLRLEFPGLRTEPSPLPGHVFLHLPTDELDFEAGFRRLLERLPGYTRPRDILARGGVYGPEVREES